MSDGKKDWHENHTGGCAICGKIWNQHSGDYCDPDRHRRWMHESEVSYVKCANCGIGWDRHEGKACEDIDVKPSNPKDAAATDRLDMGVWPVTATAYGALAMTEGAYKYGSYNYRVIGVSAATYLAALSRHIGKWQSGEEEDPATGVPHLANAIACIGILIDAKELGMLTDDRPPKTDFAGLLERFRRKVRNLQTKFPQPVAAFTEARHGKR